VGTDHEVDCDLTNTLTSPLIRSLVCSSGRKTPHRRPSHRHRPGDPGPHRIRCLSPTVSISATTSSTSTYTSTFPLIRSLVCSNDRKTPHRHPSHRHCPGDPGPRRIRCLSPRRADLLPRHRQVPLHRLHRCRAHRTSPLVGHTNTKPLSTMFITFRPTRCRPSRSLSTYRLSNLSLVSELGLGLGLGSSTVIELGPMGRLDLA
jgi:hypothetical protein